MTEFDDGAKHEDKHDIKHKERHSSAGGALDSSIVEETLGGGMLRPQSVLLALQLRWKPTSWEVVCADCIKAEGRGLAGQFQGSCSHGMPRRRGRQRRREEEEGWKTQ